MKQLMSSKLFLLLTKTSESKNFLTKLEEAYEEFAVKLYEQLQSGTSLVKLYYNLGYIRLELAGLCQGSSGEEGKKCPEVCKQSDFTD